MGKFGEWLQVGANVGILGGLILVGFQMKQNNDLQRFEQIARSYEADMAHVLATSGENPADVVAKAIFNPKEMTPADRVSYSAYLHYMRMLAERNAALEYAGLFDEDWERMTLGRIAFIIGGNPTARQWWRGVKYQYPEDSEFVSKLETLMDQIPEDTHSKNFGENMMVSIEEE